MDNESDDEAEGSVRRRCVSGRDPVSRRSCRSDSCPVARMLDGWCRRGPERRWSSMGRISEWTVPDGAPSRAVRDLVCRALRSLRTRSVRLGAETGHPTRSRGSFHPRGGGNGLPSLSLSRLLALGSRSTECSPRPRRSTTVSPRILSFSLARSPFSRRTRTRARKPTVPPRTPPALAEDPLPTFGEIVRLCPGRVASSRVSPQTRRESLSRVAASWVAALFFRIHP